MQLAVVVPAWNEARRLRSVLRSIPRETDFAAKVQVIVCDDGSQDETAAVARSEGAIVVRHAVNLGKGAALRTGTEAALRVGADIVVHMDADGQHDPEDLPALVGPLLTGADATVGLRQFAAPMPRVAILGNRFLSWATRLAFGVAHADSQCGYRAFWARCWPLLEWTSSDYAMDTEILARGQRHGVKWVSVPVRTIYLDSYKGTGIVDGWRILGRLVRWRIAG